MDNVMVLFRFTDSAFGITGWGVFLLAWLCIIIAAVRGKS